MIGTAPKELETCPYVSAGHLKMEYTISHAWPLIIKELDKPSTPFDLIIDSFKDFIKSDGEIFNLTIVDGKSAIERRWTMGLHHDTINRATY